MKPFVVRQLLLGALLAVASCSGCKREVRTTPVPKARYANPTPEQSFETIFDTFRRRIEDTPVGFVVSDSTSRTSMIGSNKVSSELIPPAKEGDPYKAVVTVVSESRYSIMRTKEDDSTAEANAANRKSDPLGENKNEAGEPIEPSLPPRAEVGTGRIVTDVIKPPAQDKQDIRKYELEYKNGRWELMTKLDTKTEQSIQNAFKNALDTQNSE